jgi:uncharacterized protein (TIGR02466 family)
MADSFTDSFADQFPTMVLWRRYRDVAPLNAALAGLIRELRDTTPNAAPGSSTRGGYQTDTNFLYKDHPAVNALRQMLNAAVQSYLPRYFQQDLIRPPKGVEARLWGWAVIMQANDYNVPHVHPDAHLSGVYYVEVPELSPEEQAEQEPGGSIVFLDPRPGANMYQLKGHRSQHSYVPAAGSLVMFPSYHMHAVFPFRSPGERISIAFNARLNVT